MNDLLAVVLVTLALANIFVGSMLIAMGII